MKRLEITDREIMQIALRNEILRSEEAQIDVLKEENQSLKQKLRYQERKAQEGFFGSRTKAQQVSSHLHRARYRLLVLRSASTI